jgi:hypothetical protein
VPVTTVEQPPESPPNQGAGKPGLSPAVSRKARTQQLRAPPQPPSTGVAAALRVGGSLIAPTALLSALAFYFGATRTNTVFTYFGVDPTLVGLPAQEYILRSIDGAFAPIVVLLTVLWLCFWAHSVLQVWLAEHKHPYLVAFMARILIAGGAPILSVGLIGGVYGLPFDVYYLLPPLCLGVGAAAITYGFQLLLASGRSWTSSWPPWLAPGITLVTAGLVASSVFWAASLYAGQLGRQRAEDFAASLPTRPEIVVYSQQRLYLPEGGAVRESSLGGEQPAYRYRYTGLRLLIKSGGNYFLLPADWQQHRGAVIVLRDDQAVRLDLVSNGT